MAVQSLDASLRKICAISFGKDDSVYVHMPYFRDAKGMLLRCVGRLIDGQSKVERIELPHTTINRVKFSYHPDGRAHFSQDRKIKTVVVGSLPPLGVHTGILFQLQAYGFDHFEAASQKDLKASPKKALVYCNPSPEAHGIIITGHISKPGVACTLESAGEPKLIARSPNSSFLIVLSYKNLRVPTDYDGSHLCFLGGPSAPAINAACASRSVLVAVYPRGAGQILFPDAVSADYQPN